MMEVITQCFRCFYVFFIILKYGSSADVLDTIYFDKFLIYQKNTSIIFKIMFTCNNC